MSLRPWKSGLPAIISPTIAPAAHKSTANPYLFDQNKGGMKAQTATAQLPSRELRGELMQYFQLADLHYRNIFTTKCRNGDVVMVTAAAWKYCFFNVT